jgi:hypothetical protein
MENINEINQPAEEVQPEKEVQPDEPVKRKRGRPPKPKAPKIPKKNGRPLKYPDGTRDYHRKHIKVEKNRYKELVANEQKYFELIKVQNI